ncbi:hypothetical protein E3U55_05960 [Filobacillus milosensis]|uniref:Inhibitor I9 domain-containing protein n=1 Tax=Filobacillus milosensis TaxID=94137 RepID=A0A4Y8IN70_9BACI|nr:protease inhibitor I9 family protein [Filobacillus milosensis]TFB22779.1 hypothetical protein E3U55_05960 [Filobacillus milosensis]
MRRFIILISIFILFLISIKTSIGNFGKPSQKFNYLVHFKGPLHNDLFSTFGIEDQDIIHKYQLLPVYHLNITDKQAKHLRKHSKVKSIELDSSIHTYEN